MILQPVVENCVNHGIREMEGKREDLAEGLSGRGCSSVLVCGIMAKGISPEKIEKILNGTYREEKHAGGSNGIGMDNVIARLKLYSEMDDVMSIYSEGEESWERSLLYT